MRKIDTNGNTLWDFKYREPDPDTTDINQISLTPRSLAIGNDGNYLVGADYRVLFSSPFGKPSALIKFSSIDRHIIWRYNMVTTDTNYTYANYIEKIVPIPGEGYVLFGSLYDKRGDIAAFISKVNENGQELWRKTFGTSVGQRSNYHDDYFFDGIQTLDGGFAAVGQTADSTFWVDAWLVKTNCNGDTAAPVAQFNALVDYTNNHIVSIQNQTLRFDTCIYDFGDGSPLVYKSYLDTGIFTHTYTNIAAAYNISMIAKSCNQDYDTTQTSVTTGGPSLPPLRGGVRLYPNPASSIINIEGSIAFKDIEIYNVHGNLIEKISTKPTVNYQLSISNYNKGIYFVKVTTENGMQCLKLVVQ